MHGILFQLLFCILRLLWYYAVLKISLFGNSQGSMRYFLLNFLTSRSNIKPEKTKYTHREMELPVVATDPQLR